jgi:hypothetical protein
MPVRDFKLDEAGDRVAVRGDWALSGSTPTMSVSEAKAADLEAVAQGIRTRVRMFLGEYWLDESIGVDWLGQILIKNPNELVVRELIRRAIADTPDVIDVVGGRLEPLGNREYTIRYKVRTVYGVIDDTMEITTP